MQDAQQFGRIRRTCRLLTMEMDERRRRQWAGAEARQWGRGGVKAVAAATGLSRNTVMAGMGEWELPAPQRVQAAGRVRREGGGRKTLTAVNPELVKALEAVVEPSTRGDPESPLRWTCKSLRRLAEELTRQDHPVSPNTVAALLKAANYSLQANRKTREGNRHPDRNAQFEYLNGRVRGLSGSGGAGHLGGYEKEGINWGFQECRPRMAASGPARRGARA
jgi:hypothetical protein